MRLMGIEAIYPKPKTCQPHPEHKVYPYLLRNLKIDRPNQVWAADITYIPMSRGFMYLVAVMDWHSRKVLSWRLSNTLDTDFCVQAVEEAINRFGAPEIFNTDQGAQFTSDAFTSLLKDHDINISMDGRGRVQEIFSSSGFGERSSINIFIYGLLATDPSCDRTLDNGLGVSTLRGPTKILTI